ncbi:uncharacterized protein ATC70_013143 [Mucor velutinosus]|uniref:Uncharacterized protein n=1 Tax=Mucor velutinosus TaxID=708070 RepID=A0AAN7I3V9_9FUNG|nr:hypothetical protein ATC70_013143 [Mucor velutinosus]
MENLLGYSQYDYLVCLYVNSSGDITLLGSSNKVLKVQDWINVTSNTIVDGNPVMLVKDIFPKYFELHSKDRGQLSASEMRALSSILKYFKDMKMTLAHKSGLSLRTCQIIVVPPALADWDIRVLRTLFLEAEWVTSEEGESKLMLVPFIEANINYLQMFHKGTRCFEREGKYILLYMQPTKQGDKIIYTATCFQNQCAKELVAVSKRLASSDFLLVPSILSNRSMHLSTMEDAISSAIKEKIANIMSSYKLQSGFTVENEVSEFEVLQIGIKIIETLCKTNRPSRSSEVTIGDLIPSIDLDRDQLQNLRDYQVNHFLKDLTHDANVLQYTRAVCDFLQKSMDEYGLKNAPDGVRSVILSCDDRAFATGLQCFFIEQALLQANIIQPEVSFTTTRYRTPYREGALQRPLKITQMVNTLLPPLVQNELFCKAVFNDSQADDGILLPLNSFYLQASISRQHIEFILNKVVKIPSPGAPAELFTVLESTVEMDDIFAATSDTLWRNYQRKEIEGYLDALTSNCLKHKGTVLSLGHYKCFTANMTDFINRWIQHKRTLSNGELDTCHLISIDKECPCALKITHRMLLETGLKPVVSSIAKTIVGTTLSNNHFGLYQLSTLFVKGSTDSINSMYYAYSLENHIEEKLRSLFQIRQRKLTIIFVNKKSNHATRQYLVRGNYKQISSSTYSISLEIETNRYGYCHGLLDDHHNVYRALPGIYSDLKHSWEASYLYKSEYTILNKGEDVPITGVKRTFLIPECLHIIAGKVSLLDM